MTTTGCYPCAREAEFHRLPPRELIAHDDDWRVVHAYGVGLLGWLVLVARRHVMEVADLTDAEAAGLGVWQVRLARILGDVLRVRKTYVAEFGEAPGIHLHFHVIARPDDLDPASLGPGVFGYLARPAEEQVSAEAQDELAERLRARLAEGRPG